MDKHTTRGFGRRYFDDSASDFVSAFERGFFASFADPDEGDRSYKPRHREPVLTERDLDYR